MHISHGCGHVLTRCKGIPRVCAATEAMRAVATITVATCFETQVHATQASATETAEGYSHMPGAERICATRCRNVTRHRSLIDRPSIARAGRRLPGSNTTTVTNRSNLGPSSPANVCPRDLNPNRNLTSNRNRQPVPAVSTLKSKA